MKINIQKPRLALNKAFLKIKPNRKDIELFKTNLISLLDQMNENESEEHHKNIVSKFLDTTYYNGYHYINTKGRNDLVIHNGKDAKSSVGVIIEAKKPTNKAEMLRTENLNTKAFQELVLYYLRERVTHKNLEIKHLVATNIYEWFIFDANTFEKLFANNKTLVKQFTDFEEGRLSGKTTDFFYKEIAEPFIAAITQEINFAYFDIRNYDKTIRNDDKKDDKELIALYKLLSPEHLLKLPFLNDSNSLDKQFYTELLHIIGLAEIKDGSKKLIERKKAGQRNEASLLENAIMQLDSIDKINRLDNPSLYGDDKQERLFNVGLELSITWVNRILFLKLLEAQLIAYNNGDKSFSILTIEKLKDYDDINSLFFQVLAKLPEERSQSVQKVFDKVPYLNSSLFEPTDLEHACLFINQLENDKKLPILSSTVLKDKTGKKRTGELNAIEYIFDFLDAYDFASEGSEDIQEDNKTLINASVLGLIFEKINGYKDGSFFTPGFITMYMCRETIRRAVLQKFKDTKNWDCATLDELYNKIDNTTEANSIINSIKICDPAVGSGHFLVSALNEIITVKNDLKILQDREGKRLKEYHVEIANDELVITDEDGKPFKYNPNSKESQRVQEALFHEKQTIIENCLFGVDINPNSVKICRLRLWIELLKNAYYKTDVIASAAKQSPALETLPNIDINIKCGNSLISRFPLDADLKDALKKSKSKWTIDTYKLAVQTYREAKNKEEKRDMERLIADIKNDFRSFISVNDPKIKLVNKKRGELFNLTQTQELFDSNTKKTKEWKKKVEDISKEIEKIETEIADIKNNKIYESAFEWRFEFPEVLNDDGDYMGFDVVIGNPPYMRVQEIQASQPLAKTYYETNFKNAKSAYDLANIFFELAVNISSQKSSNAYIFPHKFFNSSSSEVFRDYLTEGKFIDKIAHFGANMIFEDADTYTCVTEFSKTPNLGFLFQRFPYKSDFQELMNLDNLYAFITYDMIKRASVLYGSNQWIMFDNETGYTVFEKIYNNSKSLESELEGIFVGLQTSKDDLYILDNGIISENILTARVPISNKVYKLEKELFKPFLMGKDVQRYCNLSTDKYVFFPYKITNGNAIIVTENEIASDYPLTYKYLKDHEKEFKKRESGKAGKMQHWHAYIYPKNLNRFEQPKLSSMEICANHPNVTYNESNLYHTTKVYSWVKKETTKESYEYLLAIANSQILWWFLKLTGDTLQGDARTFKTNYLNPFPIPNKVDEKIDKHITEKVNAVLKSKKENPKADTTLLEKEIDQLVYQLYSLTEEEIKIVESN